MRDETEALLVEEDELHLDLRALCFRYFFPGVRPRPPEVLQRYENLGSGTVGGIEDPHKARELAFFNDLLQHDGVSDTRIREAAERFLRIFDQLEARLAENSLLLGAELSLLDIAWYIYTHRMAICGFPIADRFPRLWRWYNGLHALEAFRREVAEPPPLVQARAAMHAAQREAGTTLTHVAGF